ncbi:MAG: hypothetical protein BGO47_06755 [Microbacterium sp. 67-17]|nr:MAG: hypothetical protein BGO47_06755 [Microbacterium sp. 67-17]
MGRFRMWADPADGDDVWTYRMSDGVLPEDAGQPGKALLICPVCGSESQVSEQNLRSRLVAMRANPRVEIVRI